MTPVRFIMNLPVHLVHGAVEYLTQGDVRNDILDIVNDLGVSDVGLPHDALTAMVHPSLSDDIDHEYDDGGECHDDCLVILLSLSLSSKSRHSDTGQPCCGTCLQYHFYTDQSI